MVFVCNAHLVDRDVQIPGRIAAKACGAMADIAELALLGTNPVQVRLAAQVSCVPPAARVIPA